MEEYKPLHALTCDSDLASPSTQTLNIRLKKSPLLHTTYKCMLLKKTAQNFILIFTCIGLLHPLTVKTVKFMFKLKDDLKEKNLEMLKVLTVIKK